MEAGEPERTSFPCVADDQDHAEDQALDAYPGCKIVETFEKETYQDLWISNPTKDEPTARMKAMGSPKANSPAINRYYVVYLVEATGTGKEISFPCIGDNDDKARKQAKDAHPGYLTAGVVELKSYDELLASMSSSATDEPRPALTMVGGEPVVNTRFKDWQDEVDDQYSASIRIAKTSVTVNITDADGNVYDVIVAAQNGAITVSAYTASEEKGFTLDEPAVMVSMAPEKTLTEISTPGDKDYINLMVDYGKDEVNQIGDHECRELTNNGLKSAEAPVSAVRASSSHTPGQ